MFIVGWPRGRACVLRFCKYSTPFGSHVTYADSHIWVNGTKAPYTGTGFLNVKRAKPKSIRGSAIAPNALWGIGLTIRHCLRLFWFCCNGVLREVAGATYLNDGIQDEELFTQLPVCKRDLVKRPGGLTSLQRNASHAYTLLSQLLFLDNWGRYLLYDNLYLML